ncbi:uncharacterized protein EV420DRAFT_1647187 [Desarmillaria tabescens]|uniref:Uncharacterized protein n=1 Tax=Armillaria tabescens TaxID=1929756 RepID=A0AA39MWS4_ARMTA|nr:uncharacterized protein EV420DRAFT_1647187 [Desarmillaria tabescens]KAK0448909.1 hypothetical protein EV420DRAFT_1647187 [Desarmillaria tabescens]
MVALGSTTTAVSHSTTKKHTVIFRSFHGGLLASRTDHPYRDYIYMWDNITSNDIEWAASSVQGIGLLRRPWRGRLSRAFNYIDGRCGNMLADQKKSSDYHDLLRILRSRLQAVLDRLGHVTTDTFTIQVLVATAQRFWLEIVAALDYMDWVKPVMDGIKSLHPAHRAEHRIGTFTWDVGVTQLFFKAQIPVFFIRPWESFANQVILRVIEPSPPGTCITHPAHPFPIVFDGPPSDPKKYVAQHRCLCLFQGYRDPFNFHTVPSSAVAPSSTSTMLPQNSSRTGPICLDRDVSHRLDYSSQVGRPKHKKNANNISRDKFSDLHGDYAPLAISAWSEALSSINEESERAQTLSPDLVATAYMFPDPRIITNVNAVRQKAYLRQLDHSFDALKYRATAMGSEASPLRPQQWRDLLALALKCADGPSSSKLKSSSSIKSFKAAEDMLGSCMRDQGVVVQLVPPPSSDDHPFDVHRGRQLIWELCELNFRYELLALDNRAARDWEMPLAVSATMSAINDFASDRQNMILAVFPGGSLIPSAGEGVGDGFGGEWVTRRERLRNLQELMRGWVVPLPGACHGLLGMTESEGSLKVEKALAAHYAQTFFDFFGRPPILPCRKPVYDH